MLQHLDIFGHFSRVRSSAGPSSWARDQSCEFRQNSRPPAHGACLGHHADSDEHFTSPPTDGMVTDDGTPFMSAAARSIAGGARDILSVPLNSLRMWDSGLRPTPGDILEQARIAAAEAIRDQQPLNLPDLATS